jgi:hypothetical protein
MPNSGGLYSRKNIFSDRDAISVQRLKNAGTTL